MAGLGDPNEEYPRYIGLDAGKVRLWLGDHNSLEGTASLTTTEWHLLAAIFDGTDFHLFSDGRELATGKLALGTVGPQLGIAPPISPGSTGKHFGGKIAGLMVVREALSPDSMKQLYQNSPDFALPAFEERSKPWRVQTRAQAGYRAPQDPATMPTSRASIPAPPSPLFRANQKKRSTQNLEASGENHWTIGGWALVAAPEIHAAGSELSQPGVKTTNWIPATVPGTVLSSMVDRGIYADPDYGLNNLAIPESLNKHDYWYRTVQNSPASWRQKTDLEVRGHQLQG